MTKCIVDQSLALQTRKAGRRNLQMRSATRKIDLGPQSSEQQRPARLADPPFWETRKHAPAMQRAKAGMM